MIRLEPETIERLIKLLGMLGSAHDGERAAAIKRLGLQWSDLIAAPQPPAVVDDDWRAVALACCRHLHSLTAKERAFVRSMAGWRGTPSDKQLAWLNRIYEGLP